MNPFVAAYYLVNTTVELYYSYQDVRTHNALTVQVTNYNPDMHA